MLLAVLVVQCSYAQTQQETQATLSQLSELGAVPK